MENILDFPIELWFFQILITLFPILLYQSYFKKKYGYRFHKNIIIAIICGGSIILCMSFPVIINVGFLLDFRYVPLILSFLYGGFGLGVTLSTLTLSYRILIGGLGVYLALFILIVLVTFFYFTLQKFKKIEQNKKVLYSQGLLLLIIAFYAFSAQFFDDYSLTNIELLRWVIFSLLNCLTMGATIYLQEGLNELDLMNQEVMEYEKLHLIGQLSTSIAHELKKPMENTKSLLETLGHAKQIPLQDKNKITESVHELEKVSKIIDDYLKLTDVNDAEEGLLDVHEEIDSVILSLYSFANMHNIEIKYYSTLEKNYFVRGNKHQFRQAIINIVKNGIEACQNGSIEIAVHEMLSSILIVIEDNGSGMTKKQMNRIGKPLHSTKKRGTGFGIMVSYNIINSMSGKVEVESDKGKGTSFSIMLPKAAGAAAKTI